MELKLYDTLTREQRVFTPLDPDRVRGWRRGFDAIAEYFLSV